MDTVILSGTANFKGQNNANHFDVLLNASKLDFDVVLHNAKLGKKHKIKKYASEQYLIAEYYKHNKKNPYKAFEWYYESAMNGQHYAQFCVAVSYTKGEGVDKSDKEAFKWYLTAAENNDIEGQYNVSVCYKNGIGTKVDEEEAIQWCKTASDNGHCIAQYNLANYYYNCECECKCDNNHNAFELYKRSANQGYNKAQFALGRCYEIGIGVEENIGTAILEYRKADKLEHTKANKKANDLFIDLLMSKLEKK